MHKMTLVLSEKASYVVDLVRKVSSIRGVSNDEAASALILVGWTHHKDTVLEICKTLGIEVNEEELP